MASFVFFPVKSYLLNFKTTSSLLLLLWLVAGIWIRQLWVFVDVECCCCGPVCWCCCARGWSGNCVSWSPPSAGAGCAPSAGLTSHHPPLTSDQHQTHILLSLLSGKNGSGFGELDDDWNALFANLYQMKGVSHIKL